MYQLKIVLLAHARNLGLNEAQGKYINFLDSDDYISSNTFRDVYNFFEKHYSKLMWFQFQYTISDHKRVIILKF